MRAFFTCLFFLALLPSLDQAAAAVVVTYRGSSPPVLEPSRVSYTPFDINSDGTFDLLFINNGFFASLDTYGSNRVSASIDSTEFYDPQIVPVSLGAEISPLSDFPYSSFVVGAWHGADELNGYESGFLLGYANSGFMQYANGYIGVEFMAADGLHYGWIQYEGFSVARPFAINEPGGWVNSWAYESEPNTPIFAGSVPEPSRMLFLLAGTFALICRRSRQKTELHG